MSNTNYYIELALETKIKLLEEQNTILKKIIEKLQVLNSKECQDCRKSKIDKQKHYELCLIQVNNFIHTIRTSKWGELLYISYDYDEYTDEFEIWHNNSNLEFDNEDFGDFVGGLIVDMFFEKGIFNLSWGYDYDKSKDLEIEMEFNQKEKK
jgi:hypothetical protein